MSYDKRQLAEEILPWLHLLEIFVRLPSLQSHCHGKKALFRRRRKTTFSLCQGFAQCYAHHPPLYGQYIRRRSSSNVPFCTDDEKKFRKRERKIRFTSASNKTHHISAPERNIAEEIESGDTCGEGRNFNSKIFSRGFWCLCILLLYGRGRQVLL